MKRLLAALFLSCVAAFAQNGISYHGGRVLVAGPSVYVIWYGNWAPSTEVPFRNFLSNLSGSSWFANAGSYYDSTGVHVQNIVTYAGEFADAYSQGVAVSGPRVPLIVQNAIAKAGWPSDANAVYAIIASPDVGTQLGTGWHGQFPSGFGYQLQFLFAGAGGQQWVLSHEFIETVTDPLSSGWYDGQGEEVADKCGIGASIDLNGFNFVVEEFWVNANGGYCSAGATVTPPPPPPPSPSPCVHAHKGCRT